MNMFVLIKKILNKNEGQAMVEYGLIAALVGLAMIAGTIYYFESTKVNYYNGMVPLSKGENIPPPPEIKDGNLTLVGNQKPVAVIEGPLKASVGQKLVYTDASYDLDGSIKHTSWGSKTIERVFYKEGTYVIELEVIDDKGAKGRKEVEVIVGRSIPLAVIYKDKTTRISQTDSLLVHAKNSTDPFGDKIVGAKWFLTYPNGSRKEMDWGMEGHKFEPNELEAGTYKLELQVTDEYQDVSNWVSTTIQVNRQPIANIVVNPSNFNLGEELTISSQGSTDPDGDELTEAEWYLTTPDGKRSKMSWGIDGHKFPAGTLNTKGSYKLELRVKDSHNLWSRSTSVTFKTNTKPVAIIYTNPNGTVDMNTIINVHANNSIDADGDKIVEAEWYMTRKGMRTKMTFWNLNVESLDPKNLGAGSVTFELRVKDEHGAWSDWVEKTLKLNNPPIAILELTKGDNPSITGRNSFDRDGTIVKAEWRMSKPDGEEITLSYASLEGGGLPLQEMKTKGTYFFYLRVQDNNDEWSSWTTTHYLVNNKPVAVIFEGQPEGNKIRVDGTQSFDLDGFLINHEWYMTKGNGTRTKISQPFEGFYVDDFTSGTVKLELRVQDNDGVWSDFTTVVLELGSNAPFVKFRHLMLYSGGNWYDLIVNPSNSSQVARHELTVVDTYPIRLVQGLDSQNLRVRSEYYNSGDYYPHLEAKFDIRTVFKDGTVSKPTRMVYYPVDPLSFQSHFGRIGMNGSENVTFHMDSGFKASGIQMKFDARYGVIPSGADLIVTIKGIKANGSEEVVLSKSALHGLAVEEDVRGKGYVAVRLEVKTIQGLTYYYDWDGERIYYLTDPRFINGDSTIAISSEQN